MPQIVDAIFGHKDHIGLEGFDMIPKNKMLVVSGLPRSGTSLCMQTLLGLGLDVAGDKWVKDNAKKNNERGQWEVTGVVFDGVRDLDEYGGKAIKLVSGGLIRTRKDLIWKGILCLRDPREVLESNNKVNTEAELSSVTYITYMTQILEVLREQDPRDWLIVDYKEPFESRTGYVEKIAKFVNVGLVPLHVVTNIKKRLYHCKSKEFDPRDAMGESAMFLYEVMHNPWNISDKELNDILFWLKDEAA